MAYRRRSTRAPARGRSRTNRRPVRRARTNVATRRVRSGSRRSAPQTVRIVIEQPTAAPIGRELLGKKVEPAESPKKAKF